MSEMSQEFHSYIYLPNQTQLSQFMGQSTQEYREHVNYLAQVIICAQDVEDVKRIPYIPLPPLSDHI